MRREDIEVRVAVH